MLQRRWVIVEAETRRASLIMSGYTAAGLYGLSQQRADPRITLNARWISWVYQTLRTTWSLCPWKQYHSGFESCPPLYKHLNQPKINHKTEKQELKSNQSIRHNVINIWPRRLGTNGFKQPSFQVKKESHCLCSGSFGANDELVMLN